VLYVKARPQLGKGAIKTAKDKTKIRETLIAQKQASKAEHGKSNKELEKI